MAAAMAFSRLRFIFVCKSCLQLNKHKLHVGRHNLTSKKWTKKEPHSIVEDSASEPCGSTTFIKDVLSGQHSNEGTASDFTSYRDFIDHNARIAYSSVLVKIDSQHSIDTVYKALSKKIELQNFSEVKHGGEQNTKMYLIEVKDRASLNKIAPRAEQRIIGLSETFFHPGQGKDSEEEKTSLLQELGHCNDVEAQLQLLYRRVSLPESSMRYHFFASKAVERFIRSDPSLRRAVVECFGSAPCGTALRNSADLDLTVFVPSVTNAQQFLKILNSQLRRTPIFNKVLNFSHARTPIVHMESALFHLSMDISVNNLSGILMSNVVFLLGKLHSSFLPLVVFLKYWARVNNLAQGRMRWQSLTSYMLSVLLISHLQQQGQLPPLKNLYKTKFEPGSPVGDYETLERIRFREVPTSCKDREAMFRVRHTDSSNMSDILCSFFQYYGQFDFRSHLIDVHNGVTVRQTHFFDIYVCNPHEERHNVCRNVTRDSLERFQELCKLSHFALTQNRYMEAGNSASLNDRNRSALKDRNGDKLNSLLYDSSNIHSISSRTLPSEKNSDNHVDTGSDKPCNAQILNECHWGIQTLLPLFHVEDRLPVQSPVENGNVIEDLFETTVIHTDDPDIEISLNEEVEVGRTGSLLDVEELKKAATMKGGKNDAKAAAVGAENRRSKTTSDSNAEVKQTPESESVGTGVKAESGGKGAGKGGSRLRVQNKKRKMKKKNTES